MSNQTYMTLYENEVRAVEISIRDQDDAVWYPSSAYVKIVDDDGNTVVNEVPVMVFENTILTKVDTNITSVPGKYHLIWKILKTSGSTTYTFYHKTTLTVEEL